MGQVKQISWSPLWCVIAVGGIGLTALFAPEGVMLLGFLGLVILVHEGGHLLAARAGGMKPTEYFWGFGPELFGFTVKGCRYGVRALLVGGYVKIHGMTPSSELPEGFAERWTYRAASHRARLVTILAGPGTNFVFALVAFGLAAKLQGASNVAAIGSALDASAQLVWLTLEALGTFVTEFTGYLATVLGVTSVEEAPVRFMSPVTQAQVTGQVVASGWVMSLQWFAVLSVAVGVVNLLPLPPLDGGHAVVALAEGVVQKVRGGHQTLIDAKQLAPLAYVTLGALVFISLSALVIDLRELGI